MAKLLFKLNHVPETEAEEVRELLEQAEIEFYETSAGILGLSFAAIWINNEAQFDLAKSKINEYQTQRYARVSEEHRLLRENNENLTRWKLFKQAPIKTVLLVVFAGVLFYLTVSPFFLTLQ